MDVSDIFYFFCSGEGKGSPRCQERGGVGFFFLKSQEGGFSQDREGGGAGRGWEGVCGEIFFFGGGAKYFFSGPKFTS